MGWHYKSPQSFPAEYHETFRRAAAEPNEPIIFAAAIKLSDLPPIAEKLRHFKWCIRRDPTVCREMFDLVSNFDYRTVIHKDAFGFLLLLTAKPTKVSEFIRLNPQLAKEILPNVLQ